MTSQSASATIHTFFYDLKAAMLAAIAAQCPAQRDGLLPQFRSARMVRRRNSGAGFFTDFEVEQHKVAPVTVPRVVGDVWADIDGFQSPMTFLVFIEDGYAKTLEGATCGDGTNTLRR